MIDKTNKYGNINQTSGKRIFYCQNGLLVGAGKTVSLMSAEQSPFLLEEKMPKGLKGFQKGNKLGLLLRGYKQSEEHKRNARKAQKKFLETHLDYHKGSNHPNWRGGRRKTPDGYIIILKTEHPFCNSHHYVCEHRLVVEEQIGRYLKPKEESHHINKIRSDNHPKNLMAFINKSAHRRFERGGIVKSEEIIFDGRLLYKN